MIAGSMAWEEGFRVSTESCATDAGELVVHRIHRDDLYFDHWHKAREPRVGREFERLLRAERPDLVHVHHWLRLTDDLVAIAARLGLPSVVTLHDFWPSCLVTFRVRPATREACDAPLAPDPCIDCAAALDPPTPWVARGRAVELLERRRDAVASELSLARELLTGARSHAAAIAGWLGLGAVEPTTIPPGIDYAPRRRAAPDDEGPLRLGLWGHLSELKGADLVLDAVRRLPDPRAVQVRIAGGEVDADYARRVRAAAEGLDVRFHGPFERDELERHPVTDVHLMVSGTRARESWGLVLDEALLLGLPSLVPASGAFVERTAGAAWARTYRPHDPGHLAAELAALATDRERVRRLRAAVPPAEECVLRGVEHARRTVEAYTRAVALGPPPAPPYDARDEAAAEAAREAWDRACRGGA